MRKLPVALAALGLVVLTGCGATAPYAAIVNDERISADSFEDELDAIANNEAFVGDARDQIVGANEDSTYSAGFVAQLLNERVIFEVIHDYLADRNVPVTPEDLQSAQAQLDQQGAAQAQQGGTDAAAVAAGFPAEYRETRVRRLAELNALRRSGLPPAEVACVRHILVGGEDEARAVRERITGGEDFAAVAAEVSRDDGRPDPSQPRPAGQPVGGSAAEGGSLGCLGAAEAARFVGPFRAALPGLDPGEVSQPVQTQFGHHLIEVTERRPAPEPTDPEERQQADDARLTEFLRQQLSTADVTVNPRYGRFERTPEDAPFPSVVPNEPPSTAGSGGPTVEGGREGTEGPGGQPAGG